MPRTHASFERFEPLPRLFLLLRENLLERELCVVHGFEQALVLVGTAKTVEELEARLDEGRVDGLFPASGVAYERSIEGRRRKAAFLIVRLVDRAVALHLEALTIKSNDLLGLFVFQPAYDRRYIDGLARKLLQHSPAPKQEFFERRF